MWPFVPTLRHTVQSTYLCKPPTNKKDYTSVYLKLWKHCCERQQIVFSIYPVHLSRNITVHAAENCAQKVHFLDPLEFLNTILNPEAQNAGFTKGIYKIVFDISYLIILTIRKRWCYVRKHISEDFFIESSPKLLMYIDLTPVSGSGYVIRLYGSANSVNDYGTIQIRKSGDQKRG
jgi:hypothetical protein